MFCGNCGFKLSDTQKFCPNCGCVNSNFSVKAESKTEVLDNTNLVIVSNDCDEQNINAQESITSADECVETKDCNDVFSAECECESNSTDCEEVNENEQPFGETAENIIFDAGENPNCECGSCEYSQAESVCDSEIQQEQIVSPGSKPKKRVLSSIIGIFLCIILSICFLATTVLQIVRTSMSLDGISNALSDIDLKNINITDILTPAEIDDMGLEYKSDNLIEFIIDNVDQSRLEKPLTEKDIEEIIDNDDILNSFRNTLSDNLKKLTEGKRSYIITVDDICEIVEEERDFIEDVVGYSIEDKHLRNLRNYLEDNYDDVFAEIDTGSFGDVVGEKGILTVALDLTAWLCYVMIIISLLFAALIVLVLRSFRRSFKYIGITGIVCGIIEIAAAITCFSLINLISMDIKLIKNLLSGFLGNAVQGILWFGIVALIVGVILLTTAILIRVFSKRKRAKV